LGKLKKTAYEGALRRN